MIDVNVSLRRDKYGRKQHPPLSPQVRGAGDNKRKKI
jgi:hypothetical protein